LASFNVSRSKTHRKPEDSSCVQREWLSRTSSSERPFVIVIACMTAKILIGAEKRFH
jgi:hypothetical protein